MARAYDIQPWEIHRDGETNLYPNVSKITRLVCPKHALAATNLKRELDRGALAFNDALEIARGSAATREECRRSAAISPATRPSIDLSTLFVGVISAASQAGYTSDEINTALQDALDESNPNDA